MEALIIMCFTNSLALKGLRDGIKTFHLSMSLHTKNVLNGLNGLFCSVQNWVGSKLIEIIKRIDWTIV